MEQEKVKFTETERGLIVMIVNLNYCIGQAAGMCDDTDQETISELRDLAMESPEKFFADMIPEGDIGQVLGKFGISQSDAENLWSQLSG